jgi:hypothetical protein
MNQKLWALLMAEEQDIRSLDKSALSTALEGETLTFVLFSCLTAIKGNEEIDLDFFRTKFFFGGRRELSSKAKRAVRLIEEIGKQTANPIQVIPILVDTEPRRIWGWQTEQSELTAACELMIEQTPETDLLPKNWQPVIWSELEGRYDGSWSFGKCLALVRGPGKHQLLVGQQEQHLADIRHEYHALGVRETAIRRVAGYAFEGLILEKLFPRAILLQSEWPWREKDVLYQWLRAKKNPLAIIHPFPR